MKISCSNDIAMHLLARLGLATKGITSIRLDLKFHQLPPLDDEAIKAMVDDNLFDSAFGKYDRYEVVPRGTLDSINQLATAIDKEAPTRPRTLKLAMERADALRIQVDADTGKAIPIQDEPEPDIIER